MVTTLVDWLKIKFDMTDAATQPIVDAAIGQVVANHRIRSAAQAEAALNINDSKATVNSTNGRVTITLTDLDDLQTSYGHEYIYYLFGDTVSVEVNGTVVASSSYTFYEPSLDLVFASALSGTDPVVTITGNLLDFRKIMLEVGDTIELIYASLPSVRNAEFENLAKRIRSIVRQQYSAVAVRR